MVLFKGSLFQWSFIDMLSPTLSEVMSLQHGRVLLKTNCLCFTLELRHRKYLVYRGKTIGDSTKPPTVSSPSMTKEPRASSPRAVLDPIPGTYVNIEFAKSEDVRDDVSKSLGPSSEVTSELDVELPPLLVAPTLVSDPC